MRPHLFVDEAKSRGYLMIVVCVLPADLAYARGELRELLLPNQRKIHFTSERDSRRRFIITEMMKTGVTATIYAAPPGIRSCARVRTWIAFAIYSRICNALRMDGRACGKD